MAAIAAEHQQQVAVGFKGNTSRGRQDTNLTPAYARPQHVTCLYPDYGNPGSPRPGHAVRVRRWVTIQEALLDAYDNAIPTDAY